MLPSRVVSRASRSLFTQYCRSSLIHSSSQNQRFSILTNPFHSLSESPNKVVASMDYSILHPSTLNLSASPKPSKKKSIQTVNGSNIGKHRASSNVVPAKTNGDTKVFADEKDGLDAEKLGACTNAELAKTNGDAKVSADQKEGLACTIAEPAKTNEDAKVPNAKVFADGLGFGVTNASKPMTTLLEDMAKLVAENEEILKLRLSCKKTEKMQERILHSIANLEKRQEKIIRRHADLQKTQEKILGLQEKFLHGQEETKETYKLILQNCSEMAKIPANVQTKLHHGHEEMKKVLANIFAQQNQYSFLFDLLDKKLNKILAFTESAQAKAEGLPKCYGPSNAELKVQEAKIKETKKTMGDAEAEVETMGDAEAEVALAAFAGFILSIPCLCLLHFWVHS